MHMSKEYNQEIRQINKQVAKVSWYQGRDTGLSWRHNLKGEWVGARPSQRKVKGMEYSLILQVPNTEGSLLMNMLARKDPKIAKLTGYTIKIIEKGGVKLSRLFNRMTSPDSCNWDNCAVCCWE